MPLVARGGVPRRSNRARWCPRRRGSTPSSRNCTPTTPTLSRRVRGYGRRVPFRVAPAAGAVNDTVGGVVSEGMLLTVTVRVRRWRCCRGVAGAGGQGVGGVGRGGGIPADRIGRGGVFGAERVAVEEELHADNSSVVTGVGGTGRCRSPSTRPPAPSTPPSAVSYRGREVDGDGGAVEVAVLPAASRARAVKAWAPLVAVVVSQLTG